MKKQKTKKLSLNKSTLANLTSQQLQQVVGGMPPTILTSGSKICKTNFSDCHCV